MGFIYAFVILLVYVASLEYETLYASVYLISPYMFDTIIFLFFIGVLSKSAQLGLHL